MKGKLRVAMIALLCPLPLIGDAAESGSPGLNAVAGDYWRLGEHNEFVQEVLSI